MSIPSRPLVLWLACALLLIGRGPAPALAHESQLGLLELRQVTAGPSEQTWEVLWRVLIYYGRPHPARLELPAAWQPVAEPPLQRLPSSELHRQLVRIGPETLDGSIIGFPGLEQTITDVFVRVTRLDGTESSQGFRPWGC
jgi:hypothetical protein